MLLLFVINISLYFGVQVYKLVYLSKFFPRDYRLLNPFVIWFASQLPVDIFKVIVGPSFLLDKGLEDEYYNIAVIYTTLSLVIDVIILRFAFYISKKYHFQSSTFDFKVKPSKAKLAAFTFYLMYLVCFIFLASSSFGLTNWISDPRVGYQHHREGAGQFWLFSISFLSISFSLVCLYVKRYINLFLILPLFIFSSYLLGSKGIVLEFLIFFIIALWLRRFKRLKLMFIIGVPLSLGLMLYNFFGGNFQQADLKDVFSYFDYYYNSAMYYKEYYEGRIELFNGQVYLSEFWNLVPRGLYPAKPYVYGITHVNEYFWPGAAEATNTPAFGGPVRFFADFGIFGIVLFEFFNPFKFIGYLFLCQLMKNYNHRSVTNNGLILLLFIFFSAPVFLMSLPFPLNFIFFFLCAFFIFFYNKVRLFQKIAIQ